jgi:phenylpyruvate tautomerase PptA (4-oxalocrotonate tautomerase family)
MPFINVKTNTEISDEKKIAVKTAMGKAITAIPGKSETWLMVGIQPNQALYFKGTDEPCAMVDVDILGTAQSADLSNMTAEVCNALEGILDISPSRIYVKYSSTKDWGWNGGNF